MMSALGLWLVVSLGTIGDSLADRGGPPRPIAAEESPVAVPAPSPLAMQHDRTGNWLWAVGQAWALLVPAALLFSGASARLRDASRAIGRRWYFAVGTYAVLYLAIDYLIGLPLDYYRGFLRPHAYGLSRQDLGKWFGNSLKEVGVSMLVGALFLWVPYQLLRRSPRRWWLYCWLLSIPFLMFVVLLKPIWFDPLFNRFGPMRDPALERKIGALARRAGIEGGRIFEVDKSRDTKAMNAYVTGFLDTKRIVLWDTIVDGLDEDELLFVMGHEMGHYALGHVVRSLLLSTLLILAGLYLVHRSAGGLIRRFGDRFGFDSLADVASVPLFLVLFGLFGLAARPIVLAYSRDQEREADRFAIEITRANRPGATAFVKFQRENLGNPRPGPVATFWRATHPSLGERIDFCNAYRPWKQGRPPRYGHLFR